MRSTFKVLFYLKKNAPKKTVMYLLCAESPLTALLLNSVVN